MKPDNAGTGLVIGQFGLGVVDSVDPDMEPEVIPLAGTVTFTPSVPYLPNPTAEPNPITIVTSAITAVLDHEGYVCTPGPDGTTPFYRGVRLFATNDPDLSVENWTWSVVYTFQPVNGIVPKIPSHAMALLEGEEIDLTKVVPVPSSPGIGTPQALALLAAAEAAAQSVRADADAGLFNGEAATLQIGSVSSGPVAEVINIGDEQNAIFDITLEKGDKGDPGTGIPDTGEALQVMRMDSSGTSTEWVTPTKDVVGLSNVDNTTDLEKPISTATQEALGNKADLDNGIIDETQIPSRLSQTTLYSSFVRAHSVIGYGAIGDGIADDTAAIQAAIDAAIADGGGEVFFESGSYKLDGTLNVSSNLLLRSSKGFLNITGNRPGINIPAGTKSLELKGLGFTGTLPADEVAVIQNQVGIKGYAEWDNTIDDLKISECKFERIQGTGIQLRHVRDFRIERNTIKKHGYAAIGCHSAKHGHIEGNEVEGTRKFPSYVANSYGIYVSTLESAGFVGTEQNPRSSDVVVQGNKIRKQVWSCLDTHVGERISFIGNQINDSPASAINAVYISMTVGDPDAQLAPKDILIEGNTITYPALWEPLASMTMGILLRGSVTTDNPAQRERATGIIRGNIIRRMGRQDTSTSGGIFVGSGLGVIVDGNTLNECRSIGVHVRDSKGTVVSGNTFTDLWRSTGSATAVFLGLDTDTEMDVTVTNNRFVRGSLSEADGLPSGASVNNSAINGTNVPGIKVIEGNNEWGEATFANSQTRYQVGTGRLRRMSGTAAPTSGSWLAGEQVINSNPSPGGYLGWVCTTNGSPGIWKGYGLIAA